MGQQLIENISTSQVTKSSDRVASRIKRHRSTGESDVGEIIDRCKRDYNSLIVIIPIHITFIYMSWSHCHILYIDFGEIKCSVPSVWFASNTFHSWLQSRTLAIFRARSFLCGSSSLFSKKEVIHHKHQRS